MRSFAIFVLIILLALIKSSLLPFNLLFGAICFLATSSSSWEIFLWAFLSGLFLDLFEGTPLGFSSLGFLAVAGIFSAYRQRFSFRSPVTVFVFVFLGNFIFSFFARKPFFIKEALFWATVFTFLRIFVPLLFEGFSLAQEEQKIKV